MSEFTQGVCADGAAILKDGVMLTIEEIIELLRQGDALMGRGEPVAWMYKSEPSFDGTKWHDSYETTTSRQVALFKDKNAQPLYTQAPAVDDAVIRDAERYRWLRRKVGATGPAGNDYSKWQFTFPTNLTLKVSELNITDIESDFNNSIDSAIKWEG